MSSDRAVLTRRARPCLTLGGLLVALALIGGCASPKPVRETSGDVELNRLNRIARDTFDRGAYESALEVYAQALARARAHDDARPAGNAAYHIALCHLALDRPHAARPCLAEAEAELSRAGENLADVLLLQARLAWVDNRHVEAERYAARVLSHPSAFPGPIHRAEVALLRGHLACDQGQGALARPALAEAWQQAAAAPVTALRAGCERLAGRLDLLDENPQAAAHAFDREAALWREARESRALSQALARAAEAWRAAGQPQTAGDRFYRAARSALAQGRRGDATRWAAEARAAAEAANDQPLRQRCLALQAELETDAALPQR
ncbi:MAG: hypothetical protein FJ387_24955 [Verrucomicrobia bacterium]|nr:hypothetical protein [Verrucomicrobiota bacterium]